MEPFATIEDLEARWRTLTEDEQEQAETTLLDATAFITAEMRRYHVPVNTDDEVQHQNLVAVTCAVAKRSLLMAFDSGNTLTGVSKYQEQADVKLYRLLCSLLFFSHGAIRHMYMGMLHS